MILHVLCSCWILAFDHWPKQITILTMISLGAQRSDWTFKSPHNPRGTTARHGTKHQLFPKRRLFFEETKASPVPIEPNLCPDSISPVGSAYEQAHHINRPRHVPIVISQAVIRTVLKDLPKSPIPSEFEWETDFPSIFASELNADRSQGSLERPRHVPIVIPSFAQPHKAASPFPSNNYQNTSRGSPTSPYSCKPFYFAMSRPTTSGSRTSTLDSSVSAPSPSQVYTRQFNAASSTHSAEVNGSQTSLVQPAQNGHDNHDPISRPSRVGESTPYSAAPSPAVGQHTQSANGTTNLSGLVCNVHKSTGKEPHALVGATTTILGDKLYVFGGRVLSRRRPPYSSDLYELDLIRRHWTRIETFGDIPPPRYFHSVCALGDTKLICYGGMSPIPLPLNPNGPQQAGSLDPQPEVVVLSDIHIFDAPTRTWKYIHTANTNTPQGRYAHCAAVIPSAAVFASANAPLSAIHHNPSSEEPNQGTLGVDLDGTGGAEMIVVGGQDSANQYIEQVSVFNLRSLKWTATHTLGRSCGAYRSVVAPLINLPASRIGKGPEQGEEMEEPNPEKHCSASSMLIYSNYNFLDVKLELQVRSSDGSMTEKHMNGQFSPPGLRFPNGGVIDNNFVVSGTYLTSSKQEYALWALDLRTLIWSRIDAGGGVFSQGSWNRGVLWSRRNVFVILGNRKRSLVEDYNHRRINFSNVCMVELEAFGLYDNPRRAWPTSAYPSISAPIVPSSYALKTLGLGGRPYSNAAVELGRMVMGLRELADMDIIAIGGERIPVNSHLLARRWGPCFVQLLRESALTASNSHFQNDNASSKSESNTLRPLANNPNSEKSRNSSITITPSVTTTSSAGNTSLTIPSNNHKPPTPISFEPPTTMNLSPTSRPRALYLPHTVLTLRALVHYFYTSSLPVQTHPLCTPQILCSLLQLARPYRIDGLLEAVVERLHQVLDGRNAAAVFNAAAMAAGGGRGTGAIFSREGETRFDEVEEDSLSDATRSGVHPRRARAESRDESESELDDDDRSEISGSTMSSVADSDYISADVGDGGEEIWGGDVSCVVGLQKRGLRGLMEGRRMRERGKGGVGIGLGIA